LFIAMTGIGAYLSLTYMIKGENEVMVPTLLGKDVVYVLEVLSDLGLNTRVKKTQYHETVLKHHVIDQSPEPGSVIKKGRDVRISVSRGPESVRMPNLTGLSLQHAEILLTENGLCRGAVARMSHRRYMPGQIMAQYPPPGKNVLRNTCTDLLVSKEMSSAPLPLTDLTQIHAEASSHGPVDGVDFLRFTLENGFLKKRIQVELELETISIELFDDFISPGREIWLLVPKSGNPTIRFYVDGQLSAMPSMGTAGYGQLTAGRSQKGKSRYESDCTVDSVGRFFKTGR